jgi:hypothetical protein
MQDLFAFVRSHTGLTVACAMAAVTVAMILSVCFETAFPGRGAGESD